MNMHSNESPLSCGFDFADDTLLLDRTAAVMGGMAKSLDPNPARYGCMLASGRIQAVLELAHARARSSWKKTHQSRIARTHLPHGF
jgi:hypothetical protein